jgi:hypothetical protein
MESTMKMVKVKLHFTKKDWKKLKKIKKHRYGNERIEDNEFCQRLAQSGVDDVINNYDFKEKQEAPKFTARRRMQL